MNRLFRGPRDSISASATSSVALDQILMIASYLSCGDIRPKRNAFSYLSTSASAALIMASFCSGISISLTLMVTAALVEYL